MDLLNSTVTGFTEQLASPAAVPGGGGASALAAAIGIALGDMVGELTAGKKKYADVEEEIRELMAKAQELRVKLLNCIEKDAAAFEPLSRAYGIPKDDPTRDAVMEQCLRDAAAAPLEILELCGACIELLEEFGKKGSKLVLSDAATGAMLCHGAMYGAAINVKVNTALMKDRTYAEEINRRVDGKMTGYLPVAEGIYTKIIREIAGEQKWQN
ncbi:MAG: cyclodeaminase/cyclohydrolase family protein [Oscillospiraceae bacterium]|nr:cyclodeaminase/cyclohydrolase family protein [Oscillospiraceae bacterium]